MRVIKINEPGGPEVLKLEERKIPQPAPDEVLIKVKAAGVNRPDVIQRKGLYPAPEGVAADIPGLEIAGIVEDENDNASWKKGDKVCALLAGGGYAEYATVPAEQCLPLPKGLTFEEGASLPETFFTVWSNIFDRAAFRKGEKVLVHGGTSGIGVTAIQMITAMGGTVYTTAGSDEKCDFTSKLGASLSINYKQHDFEQVIKEETKKQGINIVLDMIGGEYTPKNINLLQNDGRLVIINAMNGRFGEVDLMKVMTKRLIITGSTLRARDRHFKGAIARNLQTYIWPLIEHQKIRPIIDSVFPLNEADKAHKKMESSSHIGKIILSI